MGASAVTVGVSLKMYFRQARTLDWSRRVADLARTHQAVTSGLVEVFALPAAPLIPPVLAAFAGTRVGVGAQDLSWADSGAYTGETSGTLLRELGCRYAEVGHAERRRLFGEDDQVVAAKTAAALRNGLTPVLCVGEPDQVSPAEAARRCTTELDTLLATAGRDGAPGRVVVAYEPHWAIGAPEPASAEHIATVCAALRRRLAEDADRAGSRVIYGGSAGPGLLTELGTEVGGLFLGRFAHDPDAVATILDEALALHGAGARAR
ncbi:triose-phosphate isomerase family protein [Actinoalloteichus spitiensis]|uniref:triose-phosphate isomerase family protein n=1 Tax=Actinoalloteichus spitiensis TaxID=252394 RepID=UPI000361A4E8|nr:triose-phosphate isomerase family protein [Actinoalloteichus spitiensis]